MDFTEDMILTEEEEEPLDQEKIISIAQKFMEEQYGEAVKDYKLIACKEAFGAMVRREKYASTNDYTVSFGLLYGEGSFIQGNYVSLRLTVCGGVLYASPWYAVVKLDRSLIDPLKITDVEDMIKNQIKESMKKEESYFAEIAKVTLKEEQGKDLLCVDWKASERDEHQELKEYYSTFDIATMKAVESPQYQAHY